MSLDKAIRHDKEKRRSYIKAKAVDVTCRNHGSCIWCERNRRYKMRDKHPESINEVFDELQEEIEELMKIEELVL